MCVCVGGGGSVCVFVSLCLSLCVPLCVSVWVGVGGWLDAWVGVRIYDTKTLIRLQRGPSGYSPVGPYAPFRVRFPKLLYFHTFPAWPHQPLTVLTAVMQCLGKIPLVLSTTAVRLSSLRWISCTPGPAGICRVGVKWQLRVWVEAGLSGGGIGRQARAVNHCPTPLSAQFLPPLPSPDVKELSDWSITARQ